MTILLILILFAVCAGSTATRNYEVGGGLGTLVLILVLLWLFGVI